MVPLPSSLASFFTAGAADDGDTSQERRKFSPSPESF
jgi:hypothetical protein